MIRQLFTLYHLLDFVFILDDVEGRYKKEQPTYDFHEARWEEGILQRPELGEIAGGFSRRAYADLKCFW